VYKTAELARAKRESITASSNNFSLTTHRNGFQSLSSHSCFDSSIIVSSVTLIVQNQTDKSFCQKWRQKKLTKAKTSKEIQVRALLFNSMQIRKRKCPISPPWDPGRRFMKHYYYYSLSISFSPEIFIKD